ncbi:hypothetical protein JTE90_021985 [Oedothorax gibbosus]|uniref:C-type lectin domain-containing protein n=1 Tax=Oedothorax gibbosus TaxID=931172 RepID=A0AAV6U4U2_9ARAC|nr:hypothetical protein JTE90_021985 [Oedothorax gibbosus]
MAKRRHILFIIFYFQNGFCSGEEVSDKSNPHAETASSCSKGWFEFGNMCYKLGGKNNKVRRLPWDQASERCREEYKGTLATVHSQEINDFLVAFFLVGIQENLWIGLHDRINESVYTWDDGSPVNYLNWEPLQPRAEDTEREDCVEMVHHPSQGITGQWNDLDCGVKYQFVCQKEKGKYNEDYSDPRFCPTEVGGGYRKTTSCFHVVEEQKTWSDAEDHCIKTYKGHLVTITSFPTDIFVNYIIENKETNMWIGIRTKIGLQQQWSSGWYVSYEQWALGEKPEELEGGLCVARNYEGKWTSHVCTKLFSFVCEYSTDKPPVLKRTTDGTSCPDVQPSWRDLGGDFCYYFEAKYLLSWYEANFFCMRRGGTLLILNTQEEAQILQNFVKFKISSVYYQHHALFIGLYRHMQHDEEFVWVDGQLRRNFTLWAKDEPNTEKEQCVEMRSVDMLWNDIDCKGARGYICSVQKASSRQAPDGNTTTIHHYSPTCYTTTVLVAVVVCVLFFSGLIGVIVFYFCFSSARYERMKKNSNTKLQGNKPQYRSEIVVYDDGTYADMI